MSKVHGLSDISPKFAAGCYPQIRHQDLHIKAMQQAYRLVGSPGIEPDYPALQAGADITRLALNP